MYPQVTHKLPELFSLIIDEDHKKEEISRQSIISNDDRLSFMSLKKRRVELSGAAQKFIQRQKGGTVI